MFYVVWPQGIYIRLTFGPPSSLPLPHLGLSFHLDVAWFPLSIFHPRFYPRPYAALTPSQYLCHWSHDDYFSVLHISSSAFSCIHHIRLLLTPPPPLPLRRFTARRTPLVVVEPPTMLMSPAGGIYIWPQTATLPHVAHPRIPVSHMFHWPYAPTASPWSGVGTPYGWYLPH